MQLSELLKDIESQIKEYGDGEVFVLDECGSKFRPFIEIHCWKEVDDDGKEIEAEPMYLIK